MHIQKVSAIYFSPTGHTRELVKYIAESFASGVQFYNLTSYEQGVLQKSFSAEELVVLGVPVYGGRIPALAAERMAQLKGQQTPVIILVTYGNRDYEDALLELKTILEQQQFVVVGAAALVTEHSIVHEVGHDRPDKRDWRQIDEFVSQIKIKLGKVQEGQALSPIHVKGNQPFRNYNGIPLKPKANKECVSCGFCARECPAHAIDPAHPRKTDKKRCISCMRCVTYCPQQARYVNKLLMKMVASKLKKSCSQRRENDFSV